MLPCGDVGTGGPLRHSGGALDSRMARQPLADAKGYSRFNIQFTSLDASWPLFWVLAAVVMDPSAEVRHPALGYDHGVVRYLPPPRIDAWHQRG